MTRWTSQDLTEATGGLMRKPFSANGVSIDSRTVRPGEIFVALATDSGDGHHHIAAALARGASGAMAHRLPDGLPDDAPLLQVANTLDGLWELGRFARARLSGRVVAVTGSVGKTTTKEMLRRMLGSFGSVWAAEASHNNHWGVPLTLARCPPEHDFCICEIGTNHPGEIAPLSRLARPHVALVTTVGDAHIGNFPDLAALRAEKLSIREGLEPNGRCVLPGMDADEAGLRELVITHGEDERDNARLLDYQPHPDFSDFTADVLERLVTVRLDAPGRHMVEDAVAALAAIAALILDVEQAAAALDGFAPVAGRGAHRTLPWGGGQLRLIDESYNASPKAVRAALAVLREQPGRHVVVLGDMLELGERGPALHLDLAPDIEMAAEALFTCGPLMAGLSGAVPQWLPVVHADDSAALAPLVVDALRPDDTVLVKGSLGSRMKIIVEAIEGNAE